MVLNYDPFRSYSNQMIQAHSEGSKLVPNDIFSSNSTSILSCSETFDSEGSTLTDLLCSQSSTGPGFPTPGPYEYLIS